MTRPLVTHLAAALAGGLCLFLLIPANDGQSSTDSVRPGHSGPPPRKSYRPPALSPADPLSLQDGGDDAFTEKALLKFLEEAGMKVPSRRELEEYLSTRKHSAEAYLAAGFILQDAGLLRAALEREPSNPHVLFTLASRDDFSPSDRLSWARQLQDLQPDNSLASYLIASLDWESGQIDSALSSLERAHDQEGFQSFTSESMMAVTDALRATGSSPGGASLYSTWNAQLPHIHQLLTLSRSLLTHAQAAPPGIAAILREQNAALGLRLAEASKPTSTISELVGLAIQNNAYKNLPEGASLPIEGIDARHFQQSHDQRKREIREAHTIEPLELLRNSPDLVEGYTLRVQVLGEIEAMHWLRSHSRPPGDQGNPNPPATGNPGTGR
ncbi:MAG: hypothetical protein MK194_03055 [Roseibacillus sp.]|nr:hypothetical protein [Roseibacillus sp.]